VHASIIPSSLAGGYHHENPACHRVGDQRAVARRVGRSQSQERFGEETILREEDNDGLLHGGYIEGTLGRIFKRSIAPWNSMGCLRRCLPEGKPTSLHGVLSSHQPQIVNVGTSRLYRIAIKLLDGILTGGRTVAHHPIAIQESVCSLRGEGREQEGQR